MTSGTSDRIRQIEGLLEQEGTEDAVVRAVVDLAEAEPQVAAVALWAFFRLSPQPIIHRAITYAMAKTAAANPPGLWAPLAEYIATSIQNGDGVLINCLSTLQIYEDDDDVIACVVSPPFGAFSLQCLTDSSVVAAAWTDAALHLSDRGLLGRFLSKSEADEIRARLIAMKGQLDTGEIDAVVKVLRKEKWADAVAEEKKNLSHLQHQLSELPSQFHGDVAKRVKRAVADIVAQVDRAYASAAEVLGSGGAVQELQLSGADASRGRVAVDTFEKVLHKWVRVLRAGVASLSSKLADSIEVFVLTPARGSFVIRLLVGADDVSVVRTTVQEIAKVSADPQRFLVEQGPSVLNAEAKSQIAQFVELVAEKKLDVAFSITDAAQFQSRRARLSAREMGSVVEILREQRQELLATRDIVGVLDGASHARGSFEVHADDGQILKGDVAPGRKSMLLNKVIGRRYKFEIEEKTIRAVLADEKTVCTLVGAASLEGSEAEPQDAHEVAEESSESKGIPQQDRLDRVISVVQILANGRHPVPADLGMRDGENSVRHIGYMRQAAKVLGLIGDRETLLPAGRTLVSLPESRQLSFLSHQFEISSVAMAWKAWAGVQDLESLDEGTAKAFLLSRRLTDSMAERRGRTLRTWLKVFKGIAVGSHRKDGGGETDADD
jgi:hypothetical protein